jgi:hypothetical protein
MLSLSLEILSHEDYQEEIDASYIIPQLCKMHYMEAIKETWRKSQVYIQKDSKDEKRAYYLKTTKKL